MQPLILSVNTSTRKAPQQTTHTQRSPVGSSSGSAQSSLLNPSAQLQEVPLPFTAHLPRFKQVTLSQDSNVFPHVRPVNGEGHMHKKSFKPRPSQTPPFLHGKFLQGVFVSEQVSPVNPLRHMQRRPWGRFLHSRVPVSLHTPGWQCWMVTSHNVPVVPSRHSQVKPVS